MTWSVASYSPTPGANTSINGIDIDEQCAAAGFNDAIRQIMADIAVWTAAYAVAYPIAINKGGTGQTTAAAGRDALLALDVAYRQLPQSAKSTGFTLDLTQGACHVYYTGAAATATVPPNSSVAFPIGTAITIVNNGSASLSIVRGAGVAMKWAATNTDADRTLAVGGMAALLKVGTDLWFISGAALT